MSSEVYEYLASKRKACPSHIPLCRSMKSVKREAVGGWGELLDGSRPWVMTGFECRKNVIDRNGFLGTPVSMQA